MAIKYEQKDVKIIDYQTKNIDDNSLISHDVKELEYKYKDTNNVNHSYIAWSKPYTLIINHTTETSNYNVFEVFGHTDNTSIDKTALANRTLVNGSTIYHNETLKIHIQRKQYYEFPVVIVTQDGVELDQDITYPTNSSSTEMYITIANIKGNIVITESTQPKVCKLTATGSSIDHVASIMYYDEDENPTWSPRYGDKVYYELTAESGYTAPVEKGTVIVNSTFFHTLNSQTIVDSNKSEPINIFLTNPADCQPQEYDYQINIGRGISNLYYCIFKKAGNDDAAATAALTKYNQLLNNTIVPSLTDYTTDANNNYQLHGQFVTSGTYTIKMYKDALLYIYAVNDTNYDIIMKGSIDNQAVLSQTNPYKYLNTTIPEPNTYSENDVFMIGLDSSTTTYNAIYKASYTEEEKANISQDGVHPHILKKEFSFADEGIQSIVMEYWIDSHNITNITIDRNDNAVDSNLIYTHYAPADVVVKCYSTAVDGYVYTESSEDDPLIASFTSNNDPVIQPKSGARYNLIFNINENQVEKVHLSILSYGETTIQSYELTESFSISLNAGLDKYKFYVVPKDGYSTDYTQEKATEMITMSSNSNVTYNVEYTTFDYSFNDKLVKLNQVMLTVYVGTEVDSISTTTTQYSNTVLCDADINKDLINNQSISFSVDAFSNVVITPTTVDSDKYEISTIDFNMSSSNMTIYIGDTRQKSYQGLEIKTKYILINEDKNYKNSLNEYMMPIGSTVQFAITDYENKTTNVTLTVSSTSLTGNFFIIDNASSNINYNLTRDEFSDKINFRIKCPVDMKIGSMMFHPSNNNYDDYTITGVISNNNEIYNIQITIPYSQFLPKFKPTYVLFTKRVPATGGGYTYALDDNLALPNTTMPRNGIAVNAHMDTSIGANSLFSSDDLKVSNIINNEQNFSSTYNLPYASNNSILCYTRPGYYTPEIKYACVSSTEWNTFETTRKDNNIDDALDLIIDDMTTLDESFVISNDVGVIMVVANPLPEQLNKTIYGTPHQIHFRTVDGYNFDSYDLYAYQTDTETFPSDFFYPTIGHRFDGYYLGDVQYIGADCVYKVDLSSDEYALTSDITLVGHENPIQYKVDIYLPVDPTWSHVYLKKDGYTQFYDIGELIDWPYELDDPDYISRLYTDSEAIHPWLFERTREASKSPWPTGYTINMFYGETISLYYDTTEYGINLTSELVPKTFTLTSDYLSEEFYYDPGDTSCTTINWRVPIRMQTLQISSRAHSTVTVYGDLSQLSSDNNYYDGMDYNGNYSTALYIYDNYNQYAKTKTYNDNTYQTLTYHSTNDETITITAPFYTKLYVTATPDTHYTLTPASSSSTIIYAPNSYNISYDLYISNTMVYSIQGRNESIHIIMIGCRLTHKAASYGQVNGVPTITPAQTEDVLTSFYYRVNGGQWLSYGIGGIASIRMVSLSLRYGDLFEYYFTYNTDLATCYSDYNIVTNTGTSDSPLSLTVGITPPPSYSFYRNNRTLSLICYPGARTIHLIPQYEDCKYTTEQTVELSDASISVLPDGSLKKDFTVYAGDSYKAYVDLIPGYIADTDNPGTYLQAIGYANAIDILDLENATYELAKPKFNCTKSYYYKKELYNNNELSFLKLENKSSSSTPCSWTFNVTAMSSTGTSILSQTVTLDSYNDSQIVGARTTSGEIVWVIQGFSNLEYSSYHITSIDTTITLYMGTTFTFMNNVGLATPNVDGSRKIFIDNNFDTALDYYLWSKDGRRLIQSGTVNSKNSIYIGDVTPTYTYLLELATTIYRNKTAYYIYYSQHVDIPEILQ